MILVDVVEAIVPTPSFVRIGSSPFALFFLVFDFIVTTARSIIVIVVIPLSPPTVILFLLLVGNDDDHDQKDQSDWQPAQAGERNGEPGRYQTTNETEDGLLTGESRDDRNSAAKENGKEMAKQDGRLVHVVLLLHLSKKHRSYHI